ncbi:MAG: hypothetical protein AAF221_07880 [Pseudomonadota bacterium]
MINRISASFLALLAIVGTQNAHAENVFVAIPEDRIDNVQPVIRSAVDAFHALAPGDTYTLLNASVGASVAAFKVPNNERYRLRSYRDKALESHRKALQAFMGAVVGKDAVDDTDLKSDFIATVSAIGELRSLQSGDAHVLFVGSVLHKDEADPSVSMLNAEGQIVVPSPALLEGSLLLSPFGIETDTKPLKGVIFHVCPVLPKLSPYEFSALKNYVGHYLKARGGVLATFNSDVSICSNRFSNRVDTPVALQPIAEGTAPVMVLASRSTDIAQQEVDERSAIADQLAQDSLTNKAQAEALTQENEKLRSDLSTLKSERDDLKNKLSSSENARVQAEASAREFQKVLDQSNRLDSVSKFVLFQDVTHPVKDNRVVSTGTDYNLAEFPEYLSSWCYIYATGREGSRIQITIGNKNKGKPLVWTAPDSKVLVDANLTKDYIISYRQSCRFPAQ